DNVLHALADAATTAPVGAAADGFQQLLRRYAGLHAQRDALGHNLLDRQGNLIVDEFGDLARANLANVTHLVADAEQSRFDLLENIWVATDHDLQRGLLGALRPAAHRCVDDFDAPRLEDLMNPADERRRARRDVSVDRTRLRPVDDPVVA